MRKLFVCFCVCVILLWSAVLFKFGFQTTPRLMPDLLGNVDRLHLERVCAPLATILVNSASWQSSLRQVIRETWGHASVLRPLGLGLVFGVGVESPVQLEAAACGDLLQYPGEGGYRGLPLKVSWLLRKVESACDRGRSFVVKVDDDVFVNVYALQKVLLELAPESYEKKIWCLMREGIPSIRLNHSKWFVSSDVYTESLYPSYCLGSAYILSTPALHAILQHENTSLWRTSEYKQRPHATSSSKSRLTLNSDVRAEQNAPLIGNASLLTSKLLSHPLRTSGWISNENARLPVSSETNDDVTDTKPRPLGMSQDNARPLGMSEDVYITGLLAKKAGVTRVQLGSRFVFESADPDKMTDGRTVFAHLGPEALERIEELWDTVQKHRRKSKEELDEGL